MDKVNVVQEVDNYIHYNGLMITKENRSSVIHNLMKWESEPEIFRTELICELGN